MRILVLNWRDTSHPAAGGAELYVDELARRWVANGHQVSLFCSAYPNARTRERRDGFSIIRAGTRWSVYRHAARFMQKTSGEWDVVVESVNTRPFMATRYASPARVVAIVHQLARDVWFHEVPLPAAIAGRYVLEPLWLRHYRLIPVVTVSGSTRADLTAIGFRDVSVAPPGCPSPPIGPRPKEPEITLLFVGRLRPSKRPTHAVEAWRLVRRSRPEANLWLVGDGPDRRTVERHAGAGAFVFGRVDEETKWDLLARAHLLLVPSVREGWGMVVTEAGAVGTPAIGYRVPGLVDSIRDGITGWLCDSSPKAMAAVALRALGDPGLPAVGARARKWAGERTWDEAADHVLRRVGERIGAR